MRISKLYYLLNPNCSPLGTKRGMNFTANSGERKGSLPCRQAGLKSLLFGPNPNFLFCSNTRAFRTLRLRLWRIHLPSHFDSAQHRPEGRSRVNILKIIFFTLTKLLPSWNEEGNEFSAFGRKERGV
ncbi:hypothetical protein SAMN03080602_02089 [Arenibacter troitsensis]|uniref:Uncharacterized protein n=1 Tax=Arenibacter troitsensis TaxID=188872 RepID=A0A1X7JR72_9FLAO|nr:hypothetical protein SAMN03080602_02089 [Arenibacter troitsensis]